METDKCYALFSPVLFEIKIWFFLIELKESKEEGRKQRLKSGVGSWKLMSFCEEKSEI